MFPVIRVPPKHPKLVYFSIGTILEPMVFWVTPILGIIHDISLGGTLGTFKHPRITLASFQCFGQVHWISLDIGSTPVPDKAGNCHSLEETTVWAPK